jgi:hypothetical protein
MRRWSQIAVVLAVLPRVGEAQMGFMENSFVRPYEARRVPPANFQKFPADFRSATGRATVSFIS